MKVSIITVCYNSAATIRDTIESLLLKDYFDIECVIVKGDSRDNALDIVNEYTCCIAKVVSQPDKGTFDAINEGISMVSFGSAIEANDIEF